LTVLGLTEKCRGLGNGVTAVNNRLALAGAFIVLGAAPLASCAHGDPGIAAARSQALRPGVHQPVLDGVRFWYKVAGDAPAGTPPVVFLHGGPGGGSHTFEHFAGPELEKGLRMVYFDQRGSGRSERPWTGDYALTTLVEDVERLRAHLGAPKIALMAHSFGAVLALEYAALHPERVSAMVIAGGLSDTAIMCRSGAERLRQRAPEAFAKALPDGVDAAPPDELCDRSFRAMPQAQREAMTLENMWPNREAQARFQAYNAASGIKNTGELSSAVFRAGLLKYRFTKQDRITAPVLVVAGREDHQVGLPAQRALASSLPNGRIVEMENAGHWMMVDDPVRFAREVTPFLRGG